MAKGNIGNLLQHFLAIRAAEQLVSAARKHGQAPVSITYIDPFAMGAWEQIDRGGNDQGFTGVVERFEEKAQNGDSVAQTFQRAWETYYRCENTPIPRSPRDRMYPNTAVLLRARFPEVLWDMRLHEIDPAKRRNLGVWAGEQHPGSYKVEGDWKKSPLISSNAAGFDRPVLVMLDPYKFIDDNAVRREGDGYLAQQELIGMLGIHDLRIMEHPHQGEASPATIILLSYSDSQPETVHDRVVTLFEGRRWYVERVRVGPVMTYTNSSYHQGWWISSTDMQPAFQRNLQRAWDSWRQELH